MSPQRIMGAVVLTAGIVLLIIGLSSSDSVADQVSRTFTGRFTEATTWYIISGVVGLVLGGLLVTFGGRGGKASG